MASTNVIESAFSIVERVCRNVKRWHDGDQRERWVGSGLLVAEKQFRRIQGYQQIPVLLRELKRWSPRSRRLSNEERRHKVVTREPLLSTESRAIPRPPSNRRSTGSFDRRGYCCVAQ